ncbi:MAG: ATP-grasp domain-containing protein [Deltaproteobacteria bacterium]|nr:ATP-grasp domain-containing protein [Deltaproteobacteria bacterium]
MIDSALGVRWLVQRPFAHEDSPTLGLLTRACAELSLPLETLEVTPGREITWPPCDLPTIVHGRTTLLHAARAHPAYAHAVFFDPATFTPEHSLHLWGERMLNADQRVCTWDEALDVLKRGALFVRPNDDDKRFTGGVVTHAELVEIYQRLCKYNAITEATRVVLAPVQELDAEARVFVLKGEVIGGSFYRPNDSPELPRDLVAFAEATAALGGPAEVFVMDIARVNQSYRVIESNCFNGSRLYNCDVQHVVARVSQYQAKRAHSGR